MHKNNDDRILFQRVFGFDPSQEMLYAWMERLAILCGKTFPPNRRVIDIAAKQIEKIYGVKRISDGE